MGHFPADSADVECGPHRQPGIALSGALPARRPRLDCRARRGVGRGPPHSRLSPHRRRAAAALARNRQLAALCRGDHAGRGRVMTPLVDWLRLWARRLLRLARLGAVERTLDDEMRHHIECEIAERVRAGEPPDAARRAAVLDFGGLERFKEEARDARGLRPLEDLAADTRHAIRVLRRNPASTLAVIATFALSIAAAGAIFAVVYGVLLRPLTYVDPDRLVALWEYDVPRDLRRNVVSVANFEAWQRTSTSFAGMAALVPRPVTLTHTDVPERVMGAEVSP